MRQSTHWVSLPTSCFLLSARSSWHVSTHGANVLLKNSWLCPITKAALWKTNNGGAFPLSPSVKAHSADMVRDTHTHTLFMYTPNEGLDSSRWKDSAGGCTFIKPRLDLFMFEVIWARERSLCAQTHTYTHFLITLASVFSLFHKTYWHVSVQQARYRTNGQFYLSLCVVENLSLPT